MHHVAAAGATAAAIHDQLMATLSDVTDVDRAAIKTALQQAVGLGYVLGCEDIGDGGAGPDIPPGA